MPKRNFSLKKLITFSIITICLFFIFIEIAARTYYCIKYKQLTALSYGKNFINRILNRQSQIETNIVFGISVYTDKYGFRSRDVSLVKDKNTIRVISLGGSFVFCCGVEDDQTWQYWSEKYLDKTTDGKRYEILNAGQGGADIIHIADEMTKKSLKFKPDAIILFSAYNNMHFIDREKETSLTWKMSHFFYNISLFYAMLREKVSLIVYKDNNYFLYNYNSACNKRDIENTIKLYRKKLDSIHEKCKTNNIVLIAGLQPIFTPAGLNHLQNLFDSEQLEAIDRKLQNEGRLTYYELYYYMQSRQNQEMKSFAEEKGVLLFDATSIFPTDKYLYFIDQIHLNKRGTQLMGEKLAFFIKSCNMEQNEVKEVFETE